ncbi:serine/threonine protein kinase [Actinoplanes sp. KI2]|uniref:serine/threonine-protein kinase n=1 Tax=Actinoplanes sp. KI2 TaxID=2983315 RepID=UPI0021D602CB|nr:serine/threonine-protein kinase [Actinoplanes sp. KI2]MCU7730481.1 serine/threonine protein kinase [Actinoplanes sp. KI2]
MPLPGQVLGDRYRLDDRIAAGGMGEVWRATDTVLGRDVAVKTLHAGRAEDPGFQTRFKHEARTMAVLHHPGVADVYDYGQSGPDAYIVMARVEGEALNQRIAASGRLTPAETMSIVAQAGRALEAAHQAGIVHRDVKPGNLIIQPDGTVVLVDFGVARSAESAALTGAKEVVGTALYIAPEQVSRDKTGPSADVYALGCVAYHCLAGHPPFMADSPITVALQHLREEPPPLPGDVPPPVRTLVETAMAKDPSRRFSSAAAMAEAAELASAGAATTAILAATTTTRPAVPVVAAGSNTAAVPPGSHTAVLPAFSDLPDKPGNRGRMLLLTAAALVVLGTLATVLALAHPGGLFPGSKTPPAASTNVSPSAPAQPTQRGSHRPTTRATRQNAATTGAQTTAPTPSREPTTRATTTTPPQTETTTTAATTAPVQDATTATTTAAADGNGSGAGSGGGGSAGDGGGSGGPGGGSGGGGDGQGGTG